MKGINLFLAHAPEDKEYRDKIGKHLSTLKERGFINEFCISEVIAGSDSDLSIRTLMNNAKIILLLISADFLASEECQRLEDLAFSMKMKNDAVVVPVLLRACLYDESYDKLQILPDNKKPISDKSAWADEDAALTNVAERIKQLVVKIQSEENPGLIAEQKVVTPVAPPPQAEPNLKIKSKTPWKIIAGVLGLGLVAAIFLVNPFSSNSNRTSNTTPTTKPIDSGGKETNQKPEEPKVVVPETFTVPNVQRISWDQAVQKLEAAGIKKYNRRNQVSCGVKAGMVLDQKPKAGISVKAEEQVTILVAEAPPRIKAAAISGGGKLQTLKNGSKYSQNAWALKNTNVEFSLEGTKCSTGSVTVDHAGLGGTAKFELRAGQKKSNSRFYGAGAIRVYFSSQDPTARLKLKIY